MLVLGAFWGRAGGLIWWAARRAGHRRRHGVRRLGGHPPLLRADTPAEVRDGYDLGTGELTLDLSGIRDVDSLDGRRVTVQGGVGAIEVVVPQGMDVAVDASAGVGNVDVLGQESGGLDVQQGGSVDGGNEVPDMTIEVDLGMGQVTVREQ